MNIWTVRFTCIGSTYRGNVYTGAANHYYELARLLTDAGFIVHYFGVDSETDYVVSAYFMARHADSRAMTLFILSHPDLEFTVEDYHD